MAEESTTAPGRVQASGPPDPGAIHDRWRCVVSGTRPLAIGLLRVGLTALPADIRRARVELGLLANVEGFALVETFELHVRLHDDQNVLGAVEQLALQVDADALLVSGSVDSALVDGLADRARLLVRHVPGVQDAQPACSRASAQMRSKLAR